MSVESMVCSERTPVTSSSSMPLSADMISCGDGSIVTSPFFTTSRTSKSGGREPS